MSLLISNMLNTGAYPHPVDNIHLIETHISWVILTGKYAYKIKKPVNFGFLDFSTLQLRQRFCEQEVLLNRRLAPDIYLSVVSINGTVANPVISGTGEILDYAVKMHQFPQSAQLDHMLEAGQLTTEHMTELANLTSRFHQHAEVANNDSDYGDSGIVYQPVVENFSQIREHLHSHQFIKTLDKLSVWCDSEYIRLEAIFTQRKKNGFIRQCHGDMHLRNLIWLNNMPMAFDCIEFNPHLSWIDVISEIAFLVMDLQSRNQTRLANRFINQYLENTGDYAGLNLLRFYLCYRALVRAKVAALRIDQTDCLQDEKLLAHAEFESYLQLATTYTHTDSPQIIIMHGLSAVGKSTLSQKLIDNMGLIRIRSDIERKRLFSIDIENKVSTSVKNELYSAQTTEKTYQRLAELVENIISAGYSVIVDATFLDYKYREIFEELALKLQVSYVILQLTASFETLKKRIIERQDTVTDADLAVLESQILNVKPMRKNEMKSVIHINTDDELNLAELIQEIESKLID